MTSIENLMSAADPLRNSPEPLPDAETELQKIVSGGQLFSDRVPAGLADLDKQRKLRRNRLIGGASIAAVAAVILVAVFTNLGQPRAIPIPMPANTGIVSPQPSASPSSPAPASSTPATAVAPPPANTPPPAASWKTFTDATGQATFEYRSGWTISEEPGQVAEVKVNQVAIKDESGNPVARLMLVYDGTFGPQCSVPKPLTTLDSVVLDIPQRADVLAQYSLGKPSFVYRIIEGDRVYGSMALTNPALTPPVTSCGVSNSVFAPERLPSVIFGDAYGLEASGMDAALVFNTVAEARAYMETQRYQDIKRMLVSLELRPVA